MEQQSLLTDLEFNLVPASTGQRFLNYIIDVIVYDVIVVVLVNPLVSSGKAVLYQSTGNAYTVLFATQLFFFVLYVSYMFLLESIFKGKSIGKFITGTKAVNEDGSTISTRTALLRSLSRFVPFEPFSALGSPPHPWHDKWAHTYVIDEKKSVLDSGLVQ